jgi:hypothetical protein
MILSTSLSAAAFDNKVFNGSPDLYEGLADSSSLPTAVQPGVGDSYASVLYSGGIADSPTTEHKGTNDAYGSILLDIGHNLDW